ncbi:hypothetical protein AB6A40_003068 [Gnathostoma spinigerum]|uniref:ribonuclease H n=1 Tax=Gnathostoma spinigerum TaxID=75299 RepID=A0ABD6EDZ0_9BILA
MSEKFYAVGHGHKPGVYENWADAQEQIKNFPQPAYKKFNTREEAEEYVKARKPERVSMEVDEKADKFYAVARGKVVGIFTNYDEVKQHIANYPQPMYKKFDTLDEAKKYYAKYADGKDDGEGTDHQKKDEHHKVEGKDEAEKNHINAENKAAESHTAEKGSTKSANGHHEEHHVHSAGDADKKVKETKESGAPHVHEKESEARKRKHTDDGDSAKSEPVEKEKKTAA